MTDAAESEDQALQPRLHSVLVTAGAKAIGRRLLDLDLAEAGVTTTVLKILPLIAAAGFAAIILMLTRCISTQEVKTQIDWRVLIVIACAFGISSAVTKSGVATFISQAILTCNNYWGIAGALAALYCITNIYTTFISNNAAAAMLFPIALATAQHLKLDVMPFAVTVAIAASFTFATPIGYQTNMMVYGPGGYRFTDFIRVGLPLQIVTGTLAVGLIVQSVILAFIAALVGVIISKVLSRGLPFPAEITGAAILVVSCLGAPLSPQVFPVALALFLLGPGWNFCYVGGSSLLSDRLRPAERARTQGLNDSLVGLVSATGSLTSGVILRPPATAR